MKRWFGVLIPVIVFGSLIAWRIAQKKAEVSGQAQQRTARMKGPVVASIAVVQVRDLVKTFEAPGSVVAPMNVKIAPKITGRIDSIGVQEGDRVRRGQTLVRIDDSDVEAEVQRQMASVAEARYRLAQAQLNQNPTDVAVGSQIRQQQAAVGSAEADLKQAGESSKAEVAGVSADVTEAQSGIDDAKAGLNSAEANLANARSKLDRANSLYKRGFISAQDVDNAKTSVTVYESALETARARLRSAKAQKEASDERLASVKTKGKADVEAARARLVQSRAALDSARANISQKSAYRQSISALNASVAAVQASLRSAQSRRRDTVLISPLDGYVTGRYADPGAIASPTQPILSVQFVKHVWIAVAAPEEVSARLHIGQTAQARFDSLPDRVFDATIAQINAAADPASRQFTVRVVVGNEGNLLKPGMFARVAFQTERFPQCVVVPREAIQRDRQGATVVVVGPDQKARRTPVVTGADDDAFVAVIDGIRPGDRVVTLSSFPIRDGQVVISGAGKRDGGRRGAWTK
ncbi:MAG: efflux RND transporter periplasmic adaptor subunit [Armatimonadota bacterium]|nr:efflux RND transporter periplasmic adaptor subunit [Armatimonadota bacterium]